MSKNFSNSIKKISEFFNESSSDNISRTNLLVVRDIYGRFRLVVNEQERDSLLEKSVFDNLVDSLGEYAYKPFISFRDEMFSADEIFNDPSIVEFSLSKDSIPFKLLDRQINGQDWSKTKEKPIDAKNEIPRVVFFGLKGGVGRSSALTLLSYHLSQVGKKVLLLDLDLESPGLSGLLLPETHTPDLGIVDWLIETNFTSGEDIIEDMIASSPVSANSRADIKVVTAMGKSEEFYLDKLSRVYSEKNQINFSKKINLLIEKLIKKENPDIVLIDSRSGLHDMAATSIVGLSTHSLLFGIDTKQSWQGYSALFQHWQQRPTIAKDIRQRLQMVQALMPETSQIMRIEKFREKSYVLFSERLYDEVEPSIESDLQIEFDENHDVFSFSMEDDSAPHSPIKIKWNNRFQEFDPLNIEAGLFTKDEIRSCFGELLDWVDNLFENTEIN
ncbi:KGGVGR-motif variant AAA ATPase [Serratia sp. IR-2025]